MKQPDGGRAAEFRRAVGEEHQSYGGRQRKAGPRRQTAAIAGAHQADGKSDLTAGGARQELAQPHEIGISLLVDPAAAHDELVAKIPDVSDRSTEGGDTEPEENEQNFEGRTSLPVFSLGRVRDDRHSDASDRLRIVEERHKAEIHVQLLVAVEQGWPGVIGYEVEVDFLEPA
jgi:hypothetical protein